MITVHDPAVAERLRQLRAHAMDMSDLARHDAQDVVFEEYPERGFNVRMTDMQAALGICQLEILDEILEKRARLAERYNDALRHIPGIDPPYDPPYAVRTWQSYCVRVTPAAAVGSHRADAPPAGRGHPDAPRRDGHPSREGLRRSAHCLCPTPTPPPATS